MSARGRYKSSHFRPLWPFRHVVSSTPCRTLNAECYARSTPPSKLGISEETPQCLGARCDSTDCPPLTLLSREKFVNVAQRNRVETLMLFAKPPQERQHP